MSEKSSNSERLRIALDTKPVDIETVIDALGKLIKPMQSDKLNMHIKLEMKSIGDKAIVDLTIDIGNDKEANSRADNGPM